MASVPKIASGVQKILLNSSTPVTEQKIYKAKQALESDFKPITDMRASGNYRMEIAKNLLEKCFLEITKKKLMGIYN